MLDINLKVERLDHLTNMNVPVILCNRSFTMLSVSEHSIGALPSGQSIGSVDFWEK